MPTLIPTSHLDLIEGPLPAVLTTVMPDGQPQSTVIWCNTDGVHILVNTMRGYQKERNMRREPRVTLFVFDPTNPLRNLEIRGQVVAMSEEGAVAHNDQLTMLYLGKPHFFGDAVPAAFSQRFTPVLCRVQPVRVRVENGEPRTPPTTPVEIVPASGLIPATHIDLLLQPVYAVLTTMQPDGQPQSSLVWCDTDGQDVLLSTTLERRKSRNMLVNPRATLLAIDPANSARYLEVRGAMVAMTQTGAVTLADRLTQRYTGKSHFYGDIYPVAAQFQETRVVCRIRPNKVNVDAIFK